MGGFSNAKVISVLALFSAITLPGCCAVTPTSLSKTPAPTNVAVMETVSAENDYYTYLSQDIDLDDDRAADTITAYRTEEMQDAFWLEVTFGNGGQLRQRIPRGPLYPEDDFTCADIDQDGYLEIIFPEIGSRSTKGGVQTTIIKCRNEEIAILPFLESTSFQEEGDGNYTLETQRWGPGEASLVLRSQASGQEFNLFCPLPAELQGGFPGAGETIAFEAMSQYLYACDLEEIEPEEYGFRLKQQFALTYTMEPSLLPITLSFTGTALLQYQNGAWVVLEEAFSTPTVAFPKPALEDAGHMADEDKAVG